MAISNGEIKAIQGGVRPLLVRGENAKASFREYMVGQGFTEDHAEKVLGVYLRHKVMKIDHVNGTWNVKHGAYLDKDVLARAVAL